RVLERSRLAETPAWRRPQRERRATVSEDERAGRLFRVVLADDELVGVTREREAGRGGPVDRVDPVAGPVGPRAGDVGAEAPAGASHRPEREPDHAPAWNQRKRRVSHGLRDCGPRTLQIQIE